MTGSSYIECQAAKLCSRKQQTSDACEQRAAQAVANSHQRCNREAVQQGSGCSTERRMNAIVSMSVHMPGGLCIKCLAAKLAAATNTS
jgi:hypothetical protein